MKKIYKLAAVLAAACILFVCSSVAAPQVDMDYSGKLDPFTGLPLGAEGNSTENKMRVNVAGDIWYDREEGRFIIPAGEGTLNIHSTVTDGMMVTDAVAITPDEGVNLVIYRDGEKLEEVDLAYISEPGSYVVASEMSGSNERIMSFTIINSVSGKAKSYSMPSGFLMENAKLNGQEIYFERTYVSLDAEGEYEIDYRCARTDISYKLVFEADYTPPVLKLEGVVDGAKRGEVDISDIEDGAEVYLTLNGERLSGRKVLTQSGDYKIVITDRAGNTTNYEFSILTYFNISSISFITLIILIIIAVIAYLMIERKRLRVR